MKLQEVKIMDVDSVGESSDDISLTVDTSQSVKLFNILIESYKNSRSSMIRESVSIFRDGKQEEGERQYLVLHELTMIYIDRNDEKESRNQWET